MHRTVLWALALAVGGCGAVPKSPTGPKSQPSGPALPEAKPVTALSAPPDVTSELQPGWVDLVFFAKVVRQDVKVTVVSLAGTWHQRPVTFEIHVSPNWTMTAPDPQHPDLRLLVGGANIVATGPDSDRLPACLAAEYGTKSVPTKMAPIVRTAAVALEGDPRKLDSQACHLKLFLGKADRPDDPYAEIFLDIDVPHGRAMLSEKDPEYREQVVRFFGGLTPTLVKTPKNPAPGK